MAEPGPILVIDSDPLLSGALSEQLRGMGHSVSEAGDAESAFALDPPPALLLIAGEPGGAKAIDLVRTWRAAGRMGPILVLVANADDARRLAEAGADACIAKPYRLADLAASLSALMNEAASGSEIVLGPFRFYPPARVVIEPSGRQIRLTEKEAEILAYLHRAGGRPVPRRELLDSVWGYTEQVTTHTLETHIYRLRRKLDDGSKDQRLLASEAGGYRLVMPD
jgi:DNA-binding response OmpR family regulator